MFIDKNSIIITANNKTVNMGNYILSARFGFNKLWEKDSGRNLAGTMTGTLNGIYPKIILNFRKLTKSEFETIAPILDSAVQTVSYYDPYLKRQTTMATYTGDYEIQNKGIINEDRKIDSFECSFISKSKRVLQ